MILLYEYEEYVKKLLNPLPNTSYDSKLYNLDLYELLYNIVVLNTQRLGVFVHDFENLVVNW